MGVAFCFRLVLFRLFCLCGTPLYGTVVTLIVLAGGLSGHEMVAKKCSRIGGWSFFLTNCSLTFGA